MINLINQEKWIFNNHHHKQKILQINHRNMKVKIIEKINMRCFKIFFKINLHICNNNPKIYNNNPKMYNNNPKMYNNN